jgi:uncharacterized protein YndB with AHSA1/START domain
MKRSILSKIAIFFAVVCFSFSATAQKEKSEVHVKITRDGKVIKDTTYQVEDEKAAEVAAKMIDLTLGEKTQKHGKHVYTFRTDEGQHYEWISEDSGIHKTEHSYVFAEKGENGEITIIMDEDGKKVVKKEVIIKKLDESDGEGKNEIIIITSDKPDKIDLEGENIEWIDKGDHKILIINEDGNEKTIKVITDENENSNYNFKTEDGKRIIITEVRKGEEKEVEVEVEVEVEDEVEVEEQTKKVRKEKLK